MTSFSRSDSLVIEYFPCSGRLWSYVHASATPPLPYETIRKSEAVADAMPYFPATFCPQ
jgi:hypothetical protein